MKTIKEHIRKAIDRLEGLEFYESWADSKVTEILEKLKNAEKEIETLQNTVKSSGTMPSLKTVKPVSDPYYRRGTAWDTKIPDSITPCVTPCPRDQWVLKGKQGQYTTPSWDSGVTGTAWDTKNPEITPCPRDQWVSYGIPIPSWTSGTSGTYRDYYVQTPGNQNFREYLKHSEDQPDDTDGTKLARSWVKFYDNATDAEKVKILTKIIQELVPGGFL